MLKICNTSVQSRQTAQIRDHRADPKGFEKDFSFAWILRLPSVAVSSQVHASITLILTAILNVNLYAVFYILDVNLWASEDLHFKKSSNTKTRHLSSCLFSRLWITICSRVSRELLETILHHAQESTTFIWTSIPGQYSSYQSIETCIGQRSKFVVIHFDLNVKQSWSSIYSQDL